MKILVSGLLNTETDVSVRQFPIQYYPIDYNFFGIDTFVGGVAFNIAKALTVLGDKVCLASLIGRDISANLIKNALQELSIDTKYVKANLKRTPNSAVLYDNEGKRQIYCDLKDIQETEYNFDRSMINDVDLVVACNINFNRSLLRIAKEEGKLIATDVHVLYDVNDEFNSEFMKYADILFLSDENIGENYKEFIFQLAKTYKNKIIVMGRGAEGTVIYTRESDSVKAFPAFKTENVVNTVGAGDSLFSAFLHYYANGYEVYEALRRAQIFASHKITCNGASNGFLTEKEIDKIAENN
ncbi:MAG: carbohydrate kinase family protein [Clostridia bacterium]|jgi:ribokinase|nr:carbohydrate kinase family protein [Clostridia bacterium]